MPKPKTPALAPAPVAAAPTASAAPAQAGLRKVSLAGFAVQSPASKAAKSYPLLPDPDGQVAELVGAILEHASQAEAMEAAAELLCGAPHNNSYVESSVMWS